MSLKKLAALLLAGGMALALCACTQSNPSDETGGDEQEEHFTNAPDGWVEALTDPDFSQGLNVYGVDSRYHATNPWYILETDPDNNTESVWKLAQWGCFVNYFLDDDLWPRGYGSYEENEVYYEYPATEANYSLSSDGWAVIQNETNQFSVNAQTGAFKLYADARAEYGVTPAYTDAPRASDPRADGEAWPHLLIEQNIASGATLADLSGVYFDIGFTVQVCEDYTRNKQEDMHTAQLLWYVLIQCVDSTKASFGDFYWFGIPILDARDGTTDYYVPASNALDGGKGDSTGAMICNVSNYDFIDGGVELGKKYEVSVDFYDKIVQAFRSLQENDYFTDCDLSDMRIYSTNFGWEIPGTYKVGVDVDWLSIKYVMSE